LQPSRPRFAPPPQPERLPQVRYHAQQSVAPSDHPADSTPDAASIAHDAHGDAAAHAVQPTQSAIDLQLLAAKIRSLNLSLAAVEAELSERREWPVEQLEATTADLVRLINEAELARLYYDAVSDAQRATIEPLADLIPIQNLLRQRVFEARLELSRRSGSKSTLTDDHQDALVRLERISEVLHQWKIDPQN
jgi:hypothetical protein